MDNNPLSLFPTLFTPRPLDSHKGTFGTLGIIGGAEGMSGAVVLAATAAIYMGSGKVWAGFNQSHLPMPIIAQRPEVMLACANDLLNHKDITAWVVGCGLGLSNQSAALLKQAIEKSINTHTPLLLDADALTLLSQYSSLEKIAQVHPQLILTPHPTEAARLLHSDTQAIQTNRMTAVKIIAEKYQATVVLKGHQSLVATPTKETVYTNTSGNPGLATAGSGDVLSGIIGSLLAQNIDNWQATCGGVWLHGAAAEHLAKEMDGEMGMLAGELPEAARLVRNHLTAPRKENP